MSHGQSFLRVHFSYCRCIFKQKLSPDISQENWDKELTDSYVTVCCGRWDKLLTKKKECMQNLKALHRFIVLR